MSCKRCNRRVLFDSQEQLQLEQEALRCRQVVSAAELQAQRSLLEELRRPKAARRSALGAVESMEQATERLMAACERLQPKDGQQEEKRPTKVTTCTPQRAPVPCDVH